MHKYKIKNVIGNQHGSVLLVVFTISVVIAFMLPSLYFMMLKSATSQGRRGEVESYEFMVRALKSQLEDPLTCYKLLGGKKVPADKKIGFKDGNHNQVIDWEYGFYLDKNQKKVYEKGPLKKGWKIPSTNVHIKDVVLVRSGDVVREESTDSNKKGAIDYVRIHTSKGERRFATVPIRVYVTTEELSINIGDRQTGDPEYPEEMRPMIRRDIMIRLLANINENDVIYNCFGFESYGAVCQNMGAAYNHLGPVDLKCQPDEICFTGKVGLVTNPDKCENLASIPYRALLIGKHNGKNQYICTLCRQDL